MQDQGFLEGGGGILYLHQLKCGIYKKKIVNKNIQEEKL